MMKAVNFLLGSILALPLFAHADALKLQKSTQEFDQYRGPNYSKWRIFILF